MLTMASASMAALAPASVSNLTVATAAARLCATCKPSPFITSFHSRPLPHRSSRIASSRRLPLHKLRATASIDDSGEPSTLEIAAAGSGLVAAPVVAWSLYVLKTTGCGLPPGPGGAIGALEGVSYLVVVGVVAWSLYTKVKTGSGLPNGPFGLLGAVEGLSYLVLLAAVVVFGFQVLDYGYVPSAVPDERCFG